jgi:hypothetical protein
MLHRFPLHCLACAGALSVVLLDRTASWAELIIHSPGETVSEDFSSFRGEGFAPMPKAGQLDSTAWRVGGFSNGSLEYGETATSGDFARGVSSGGVASGGIYSFEVSSQDWSLGVQPTGSDFNPGWIEMRVWNQAGTTLSNPLLGYELYTNNDQNRSSLWDVAYSLDGASFVPLPALSFVSPAVRDSRRFVPGSGTATIPANIADGESFFVRWFSRDAAGSGSRDEFALDNVRVTASGPSAVPEPGTLTLFVGGMGAVLVWRRLRGKGSGKRKGTEKTEQAPLTRCL